MGRYTVLHSLASGGFGVVYMARTAQGGSVAIKEFMPASIACRDGVGSVQVGFRSNEDEKGFKEGVRSFFAEADRVSRIKDARIVDIIDVFEANGTVYYAMVLESGRTLHREICQKGVLSDDDARKIFMDVARGISVLHDNHMLHLDIKPGNLWLRPDGSVVILDFGSSRVQEGRRMKADAMTPGFAAPEQHAGFFAAGLSEKTDMYGFAASLCAGVSGRPPLPAPSRTAADIPLVQARRGQNASRLLALMDWGMQLEPEKRPESMHRMYLDMERMGSASTIASGRRWGVFRSRGVNAGRVQD